MSDYLDPENEELLKDFFIEAEMQVEIMERTILAIENDPQDQDSVDELFRAAHTLKGGAYTVQMDELAAFTHKVEDLLDEVRQSKLEINPEIVNALLHAIDIVKTMLAERVAGAVYTQDIRVLEERLLGYIKGTAAQAVERQTLDLPPKERQEKAQNSEKLPAPLTRAEYDDLGAQSVGNVYRVRVQFDESNPMNTIGGVQEFARLKDLGTLWLTHPDFEELYEDNFFEYVDFFLESESEPREILRYAVLPDVTLDIEVDSLEESMIEVLPQGYFPQGYVPEGYVSELLPDSPEAGPPEERADFPKGDLPEGNTPQPVAEPLRKVRRESHSSVLRVESRRIDEILNLVSEAVINRATFKQIYDDLAELSGEMRVAHFTAREQLSRMVEEFARHTSDAGETARSVRKKLQSQASRIHTLFDPLENQLKTILSQFGNSATNLARNTNDLHEAVLSMRMVPINQVFSRFPRLVRDLSHSLDKKVELLLEGQETEIDKSVAEELLDPLMHCLRNSMDHGIENKEERKRNGKSEVGRLKLSAVHEGNNVIIEIADDGAGISREAVLQKAIANGLVEPEQVLSEQEVYQLIFEPGFSTAEEVSNISGRGVGLDVVKRQIEKLNGVLSVFSEPGKGSRFSIRLPLTLAIIQALLVRVRGEVYAIPITAVAESLRITDIDLIDNYEVIRLRDDVISLLRLDRIFQLEEESAEPDVEGNAYKFIVVVGTEERRVGLMVDNLIGEADVVIKPLVDRYTHSPGVAGATILGDGTVSLILDVSQLLDLGIRYERFAREQKRYL
ncbi:MAG: chemotaxis protein CheA [Spirochaetota bacterium]